MAYGMWRSRYWAVLGFEAIMAIIMIGSFITLIAATSVFKAISAGAILIAAGSALLVHGQGAGADPDAGALEARRALAARRSDRVAAHG